MDDALARMLDDMAAAGAPWESFEHQVSVARRRFAALIGARPDQVAVMPNATVGAFQVASTRAWRNRPRIVTTSAEFPSLAHVWLAQRLRGAEVVYAEQSVASFAALIDHRTRLVSIPLISYRDAARLPLPEVARIARVAGAEVFVDAYQAVGVEPVDVCALDCDFLVAGTSKYLLGLPGIAFLYVRDPERADEAPLLTGWFGRSDPFSFDPYQLDFPASSRRFETGTPSIPACYAANAGLRMIAELDLNAVRQHVSELCELAGAQLAEDGEHVVARPAGRRGAHIALTDPDPAGLGRRLATHGVVASPRDSLVRLSFHYYNDADDIAALRSALRNDRRSISGRATHHF
ncbi:aminotransferase class V-fold PLP-dependent enzyme [Nocardia sp. NPDC051900]|uniref:aminotransferase class V-fold PLP-dependent enzyme n=1 Tax=Nocardia sp. NPDC051900 TaxID=3364326 RepID=UPI0037B353BA